MTIDFKKEVKIDESRIHELIFNMETRGFDLFPGYLSGQVSDYYKSLLESALREYKPLGTERSHLDKNHIHDLLCRDICFDRLLEDPRLQQIVEPFLDIHWIMYAFTSSSVPPEGENYGGRVHVDSPRHIPNYITNMGILWALDDFTLENGCTKVLPGSQHTKLIPDEDFFEKNCFKVPCPKGSLIIFNARVWHRAGKNLTNNWRHSLTLNMCRAYMKQRMDWVNFIPTQISGQLNDQARRIIGFDTRLPKNLEEFFVPDDQRLYKPNQG